jgi:hypothetical protein
MNHRRQLVKPGTYLVPVQNDTRHAKEDIGGGIGPFAEELPRNQVPTTGGKVNAGYLGDIPEAHVKMLTGLQMAGRGEKGGTGAVGSCSWPS